MLSKPEDPLHAGLADHFPTAAAVLIELPITHWTDLQPGAGQMLWFVKPHELDH
jgi:hypothetical protein